MTKYDEIINHLLKIENHIGNIDGHLKELNGKTFKNTTDIEKVEDRTNNIEKKIAKYLGGAVVIVFVIQLGLNYFLKMLV